MGIFKGVAWSLTAILVLTEFARGQGDPFLICALDSTGVETRPTRSIPPRISRDTEEFSSFGCRRQFTVGKSTQLIDSLHRQDAERLRTYVAAVPTAIDELNTYQRNRARVGFAAYTGTLGLVLAIAAVIVAGQFSEDGDKLAVRTVGLTAGFGLTAGSLIYGYGVLTANERHLQNAVSEYNKVYPNRPIKLEFSAGIF